MAEPNDDHVVVAQCVDRVRLAVDELAHAMRVLNSSRHVQRPDATDDLLDERQGPQSRMLANNDRGVLQDVERLGSMSIVVLGLNGIGCMIAETFCRSGIGSITVCDNTTVFPADLGRSFYRPDDVGSTRVDRVQAILAAINHSVVVQKLHVDLVDRSREFEAALFAQPQTPPPNVIFVTVDDLHVVQYLNTLSLSHEFALVHVCMAPNGLSGTVLTSVPRRTPCLLCYPSSASPSAPPPTTSSPRTRRQSESTTPLSGRKGTLLPVLPASSPCLPMFEGILAGVAAHNAIKLMLDFGTIVPRIHYKSVVDVFESTTTARAPSCLACSSFKHL